MNGTLKKVLLCTSAFTMVYLSAASESYAESMGKVTILEEKVLSESMLDSELPIVAEADSSKVEEYPGVVKRLNDNIEAVDVTAVEEDIEASSDEENSVAVEEETEVSKVEQIKVEEEVVAEAAKIEEVVSSEPEVAVSLESEENVQLQAEQEVAVAQEPVVQESAAQEPVQEVAEVQAQQEVAKARVVKSFARVASRKSLRDSFKVASADGAFGVNPVSDKSLSEERGTFNPEQLGVAIFDANATNNSSENSVTGYNSISSDAFGNSKGVVSLIQNTGNNVIIQNATVVNLTIKQ